jgi:hypothetical protein
MRGVKLVAFAATVFVLAVTGCYSPKVQSGGFACSATDDPPCPSGFFCVNGLCVDHPGGSGGGGGGGMSMADFAVPAGSDMSVQPGSDMAHGAGDMAHTAGSDMACNNFPFDCGGDPACCMTCCIGGCSAAGICALF